MPGEQAQDSESDFKPNLVNSICYMVEQVRVCVGGLGFRAGVGGWRPVARSPCNVCYRLIRRLIQNNMPTDPVTVTQQNQTKPNPPTQNQPTPTPNQPTNPTPPNPPRPSS